MIIRDFMCPQHKKALTRTDSGSFRLIEEGSPAVEYKTQDGVVDFVFDPQLKKERDHYDDVYDLDDVPHISIEQTHELWLDRAHPEAKVALNSLGDIDGKTILLVGNGLSLKELYLLALGARIIYTDLSMNALRYPRSAAISPCCDCFESPNDSSANHAHWNHG